MNQPPRLELDNVSLAYDSVFREGIDMQVERGEMVVVLGPSGCGKSTLLKTILGATPLPRGRIRVDGIEIQAQAIEKRNVGIVFQDPMLFPHLSVGRNVSYGLEQQRVPQAEARKRAAELLEWVDLGGFENRAVDTLSGGQAQRVAVARAMAVSPRVLLLDEPFSALDDELRERLARETAQRLRSADVAVVYVTHSRDEAAVVADRIVEFNSLGTAPLS